MSDPVEAGWPRWTDEVRDAVQLGLQKMAPVGFRPGYSVPNHHLVLRPATYLTGPSGDEPEYPFFVLNLEELLALFDGTPTLFFSTQERAEINIQGKIGGEDAVISIIDEPWEDDEPAGVLLPDGQFKPHDDAG